MSTPAPAPLTPEEARSHARKFIQAWNSEQVGPILASYAANIEYQDPNTRGVVRGQEALARYLHRLLDSWKMSWTLREVHPYREERGYQLLWHGSFRRRGTSGPTVQLDGMDLVLLEDRHVRRNEVCFDRSALLPLMPPPRSKEGAD